MIESIEIENKAKEVGITTINVERDYIFGWLLNAIYSQSDLGSLLVLKGGNGLRKGYLPNTRFSKDLDFSVETELSPDYLHDELNKACAYLNQQTGVVFHLDRTEVKPKDVPIPNLNALEARVYFKGFYGEESMPLKTQLDITQFDRIYLPVQMKELIHPYSDYDQCRTEIRCQKAEEILASKLDTLLRRQKVADLFDLLYSILFSSDCQLNKLELVTTFLKKTIYETTPHAAKQQLLGVQLEVYRPFWNTLIAPVASLFNFDTVVSSFSSLIEDLFSIFPIPQRPYAFAPSYGYGGGRVLPSYFSSDTRNTIVSAGQSRAMVELVYDGYSRLVEPYSMKYYVRKDGVGQEYFWGFDTSGGKSGKQSIKQFSCDKIESIRLTPYSFVPRFVVEF